MKKIHYGWVVCLGCALLLFCTSGLAVNAFTIYQPYILKQNNFSNAQSSAIITVRNLFSFIAMFLTGIYYKKLSLRVGMTVAGMLTAMGFVVFGVAKNYSMYCLGAVAVGLGYGLGTMVPIATLLGRWFISKRTFAISICSAITGLSTLGIPSLLTLMIESMGLRITFILEACFIAVLTVISFLLIRNVPAEKGVEPYHLGEEITPLKNVRGGNGLKKRHWVLLVPMLLLLGAMTNVGYSHLSVLVSAAGYDAHMTALAITVSGVMLTFSKCGYGWISNYVSTYKSNWLFGAILTSGMLLCCFIGIGAPVMLGAMCMYGGGLALTTVGLTAWAGDLSRPEQYDKTVCYFQLGYAAGGLAFSTLPGILADCFDGSYVPAYVFFLACSVFVVGTIQWIYRHTANLNQD